MAKKEAATAQGAEGEIFLGEKEGLPAAVWIACDKLKPFKGKHEENPRINEHSVPDVAQSIKTLGFGRTIVVRKETNEVVAGHTTWKAAQTLGMTTIAARIIPLTDDQAEAMVLADNKLGESAKWNDKLLASILERMKASDNPLLAVTGFLPAEVDRIIAKAAKTAAANVNFQAFGENAADGVRILECPSCRHKFPEPPKGRK